MNTTDITIEQFNDLVQWVESTRKETGRTTIYMQLSTVCSMSPC